MRRTLQSSIGSLDLGFMGPFTLTHERETVTDNPIDPCVDFPKGNRVIWRAGQVARYQTTTTKNAIKPPVSSENAPQGIRQDENKTRT